MDDQDPNLKPLLGIYILLEANYSRRYKADLASIIKLNTESLNKKLEKYANNEFFELFDLQAIEKLNSDDKLWQKPTTKNLKRKALLAKLLEFTHRNHIEMLQLEPLRELISVLQIKTALQKSSFINFSIKDDSKNMHLTLQAQFLQFFLQYHMKHDMRFKAKIDSLQIEMDNPFARQQIRDENIKDPYLSDKYLKQMEVDEWCKHLLENFYPNISGIWADHTHVTHVEILHIVRFCYECGFIDVQDSQIILQMLMRVTNSLMKLEEAWMEKLSKIKKISDTMRANSVTASFASCREHIACILVQILTLYQDNYFISKFPDMRVTESSTKEQMAQFMTDMTEKNYPLFDENQNFSILFITMNFLSNTVKIGNQRSNNEKTKLAVEKIFLYVTTDVKDCFIESIKQITFQDLKYFTINDVISPDIRSECDNHGSSFKELLQLIGVGYFNKQDMTINKSFKNSLKIDNISNYLGQNQTLLEVVVTLSADLSRRFSEEDFRVAIVKESVPLMILALADYITEYFDDCQDRKQLEKSLFNTLYEICTNNNNCKGQVFKGDALKHLVKLVNRENNACFFFLNRICDSDDNIALFLGRGFFEEITSVYKRFQAEVIKDFQIASKDLESIGQGNLDKPVDKNIDVDDWVLYIILNNLFAKLMTKKFITETSKLQASLVLQEAIYPNFSNLLLPNLLQKIVENPGKAQDQKHMLKKHLFFQENISELIEVLDQKQLDGTVSYYDLNTINIQLCYSSLRVFNIVCSNVYSYQIYTSIIPYISQIKSYLFEPNIQSSSPIDPFGLDTELCKLLRNFALIPESNMLIERDFNLYSDLNNPFSDSEKIIIDIDNLLSRGVSYRNSPAQKTEAKKFIMEGLLPYIYKYAGVLLNLTHFEVKKKGVNPYATDTVRLPVVNDLPHNLIIAKELYSMYQDNRKTLTDLIGFDIEHTLLDCLDNKGNNLLDDNETANEDKMNVLSKSMDKPKSKKVKNKGPEKAEVLMPKLIALTKKIITDIEKIYENSEFSQEIQQFKDMNEEDYEEQSSSATFSGKTEDPKLIESQEVLEFYIKSYQELKNEYLNRDTGCNLISFFDKNTDNLLGVFSSSIDRIYETTKKDRRKKEQQNLAQDLGLNRFWMSPSCFAYIGMLEKLISSSESARGEFYNFLNENTNNEDDMSVDNVLDEEEDDKSYDDVAEGVGRRTKNKGRHHQVFTELEDRQKLLGMLMRVHNDILLYLISSPTQKPVWWDILKIYTQLCSLFQKLCENNFMEFKVYLSEYIPQVEDKEWNAEGLTVTEIFANQLHFILNSSRLPENRNEKMIHSDQYGRVQPVILSLIQTINELVSGPCIQNQKILMKRPLVEIYQLMTRIPDDLAHDYYILKNAALTLVLSLTEGSRKKTMNEISIRATSSILLDQIERLIKKLYIAHLIKTGKFTKEANKLIEDKKAQVEKRRLKNKGQQIVTQQPKLRDNQISPITLDQIEEKAVYELKLNVVNQTMESDVLIEDWNTLFDLYIESEEFSSNIIFKIVFNMIILWQILSKSSKKHLLSLTDIQNESKEIFSSWDRSKYSDSQKEIASIFFFIKKILLEVEIVDPNSKHLMVYFPKRPQCFMLAKDDKKNYMSTCDISDSNTKMLDLMRNFKMFLIQMEMNLESFRKGHLLYRIVSKDSFYLYIQFCWTFGLMLNLFVAFWITRDEIEDQEGQFHLWASSYRRTWIKIMCYILTALSAFLLVLWFIFRYPQRRRIAREDYKFDNPGVNANSMYSLFYINVIKSIFSIDVPVNLSLHIVFSMLGAFTNYFFITLNLLLVVNISRTCKFVIQSITLHADQLIITIVMAFFVIYSYTLLLAENFYNRLQLQDPNPEICKNIYTCFIYTMNWGFRNGGGIADSMSAEPLGNTFFAKNIYDVTFFMIINVISLNIIFGIIIDTFSQLRDDQHLRGRYLTNS